MGNIGFFETIGIGIKLTIFGTSHYLEAGIVFLSVSFLNKTIRFVFKLIGMWAHVPCDTPFVMTALCHDKS